MVHIIGHIYCGSYSHSTKNLYFSPNFDRDKENVVFHYFNKYGVTHVDKLYTASKVYHSEDAAISPRARMGRDKFRRMECESKFDIYVE